MQQFTVTTLADRATVRECAELAVHRFWWLLAPLPVGAAALLIMIFSHQQDGVSSVLLALAVLAVLLFFVFSGKLVAMLQWVRRNDLPVVYRFTEAAISCDRSGNVATFSYRDVSHWTETEHGFYVTLGRLVHALPKGCFPERESGSFREFLEKQTGKAPRRAVPHRYYRRRGIAACVSILLAFALVAGHSGVGYIRRPVTFVSTDQRNICTVQIPRFMEPTVEGSLYEGNGLTATAVFFTVEEMRQLLAEKNITEPLSLDTFAKACQITVESKKLAWMKDEGVGDECYAHAITGNDTYACYVLHWTENGCWRLKFTCPGERQDTYYGRFNTWRTETTYA